jgi:hypothetical protein
MFSVIKTSALKDWLSVCFASSEKHHLAALTVELRRLDLGLHNCVCYFLSPNHVAKTVHRDPCFQISSSLLFSQHTKANFGNYKEVIE